MKRIYNLITLGLVCICNHTNAQSIGATLQAGMYAASYSNKANNGENVTGKGHLTIGATYEVKLGNKGQFVVPMVLNYTQFGTEQHFGENQIMTHNANSINLGVGAKYFFKGDEKLLRPFVATIASYEALLNSSYYYDAQQAGDLDWSSNAYIGLQAGIGIETGLNSRIDIFGTFNLGLLNRLDSETFGTYKDRVTGLGLNFVFN